MLKRTLLPYLDDLRQRKLTNRAVAALLDVSEAHLSRTLKLLEVVKDPIITPPNKTKQLLQARKLMRSLAANNKTLTVAQAAKQANCSERTIYRLRTC